MHRELWAVRRKVESVVYEVKGQVFLANNRAIRLDYIERDYHLLGIYIRFAQSPIETEFLRRRCPRVRAPLMRAPSLRQTVRSGPVICDTG